MSEEGDLKTKPKLRPFRSSPERSLYYGMDMLGKVYEIKRYDSSRDRSLRSYSAADEYLLQDFDDLETKPSSIAIYHDRFGFLACHLRFYNPTIVLTHKSQQKAIELNLASNNLEPVPFSDPLSSFTDKIDFALFKAPKSLALFELFLQHIAQNSTEEVSVLIGFMTRHFSPKLLEIAQKYFGDVTQSRAVKKARVLELRKKKKFAEIDPVDLISYNDQVYKQYWGVFSASHIDYATQYLLEHLDLKPDDHKILDLASGNGVIGKEILLKLPNAEIHLLDDFNLAVESAKLNIQSDHVHHHFNHDLSDFEDATFELIVTNPPFHFEYEVSINIPLQLFAECHRCLKPNGSLQLVANNHLNYAKHLKSIFSTVELLAQNDKFTVHKCVKR